MPSACQKEQPAYTYLPRRPGGLAAEPHAPGGPVSAALPLCRATYADKFATPCRGRQALSRPPAAGVVGGRGCAFEPRPKTGARNPPFPPPKGAAGRRRVPVSDEVCCTVTSTGAKRWLDSR
jgi:hypothetical protein